MSEHTAGPWKDWTTTFGHPDNQLNQMVGSEATQQNIARLFSEDSTLQGLTSRAPTATEAKANARLIATAPELLFELRYMVKMFANQPGESTVAKQRIAAARAAIAKATPDPRGK